MGPMLFWFPPSRLLEVPWQFLQHVRLEGREHVHVDGVTGAERPYTWKGFIMPRVVFVVSRIPLRVRCRWLEVEQTFN